MGLFLTFPEGCLPLFVEETASDGRLLNKKQQAAQQTEKHDDPACQRPRRSSPRPGEPTGASVGGRRASVAASLRRVQAAERAVDHTIRIGPVSLELAPGKTIKTTGYNDSVPGPMLSERNVAKGYLIAGYPRRC